MKVFTVQQFSLTLGRQTNQDELLRNMYMRRPERVMRSGLCVKTLIVHVAEAFAGQARRVSFSP